MKSDTKGIDLGDIAKDSISGFQGVVVAITDWLNGCRRVMLSPKEMREGKPIDSQNFDIEQVDLVKKAEMPKAMAAHGGDRKDPGRGAVI